MPKTFTIPSVFTAIDKFTAPLRKMTGASRGFGDSTIASLDRVNRRFNRLIPSIGQAGKQFLSFASAAAISAAIIGGIAFSFNAIKDYETALASAQAITGTSNKEFALFRKEIEAVARVSKKSTIDIAKGFEIVGSAKPELLKSAAALGTVTKAVITLSKASGDDLETSALSLTGVMNQFSLGADQANRTMNALAAGSVVGSANITNVAESMKNFGTVAAGANLSVEQSNALVEVLGKFSLFGAEAGTKLRGSILKLQKAGVGYASGLFNVNDALLETQKRFKSLKTAREQDALLNKMFGAENVSTGKILLNNIDLFNEYTKGVTGTNIGIDQAVLKSNTFTVALDELKSGWVNIITSQDKAGESLAFLKNLIQFTTRNLGTIVKWISYTVAAFIGMKLAIFAVRSAMIVYNVILGISTVLQSGNLFALRGSVIAMGAASVATKALAAATAVWNVILTANPIGLIIVGVAALIGLITAIIIKYEQWGAALSLMLLPLGIVIHLIMSFRRNWEMISQAFKTGGILEGFKAIGKTILDAILMPLQQVMSLIAQFTGFDWAKQATNKIANFRAEMDVNASGSGMGPASPTPLLNPEERKQNALQETITRSQQNVSIGINDNTGRATVDSDNNLVPVKVSSSYNFGF